MRMRNFLLVLIGCLTVMAYPASANLLFTGAITAGQGLLTFTPGIGNSMVVGQGNGGNGALINELFADDMCPNFCNVNGGYLTLTTGGETSGFDGINSWDYRFAGGGSMEMWGAIPDLGINTVSKLVSAKFLPEARFTGLVSLGLFLASIDPNTIQLNPLLGSYQIDSAGMNEGFYPLVDCARPGGDCRGPVQSTSVSINTEVVPEPTSLMLLGSGLIALGSKVRRWV